MIRPDDPAATLADPRLAEPLNPPARYLQTRQTELQPRIEEAQLQFGPGKDLPAGDPHPAQHELTYTVRRQSESWRAEFYTGQRAVIGEADEAAAHYSYREPWDIKLPNDRGVEIGVTVTPWDYGLSAPNASANIRV